MDHEICLRCGRECTKPCEAINTLNKIYLEFRQDEKAEIVRFLRKELIIFDYEIADDLKELGESLINALPELSYIKDFDVKIGYVRSYEEKFNKGMIVNADCRKVISSYTAYLPFDFIITFYEPNVYYMTDNQKKILMLHELKHIGIGQKGLKVENHDIEDFADILQRYGLNWNKNGQDVPDILGGDEVEKTKSTKRRKVETKCQAD